MNLMNEIAMRDVLENLISEKLVVERCLVLLGRGPLRG